MTSAYAITLPARSGSWTHARLALMVAFWLNGRSASEIATQLGGTSKGAVIGQLRRLGYIGRQPWRAARRRSGPWAVWSGALGRRRASRARR